MVSRTYIVQLANIGVSSESDLLSNFKALIRTLSVCVSVFYFISIFKLVIKYLNSLKYSNIIINWRTNADNILTLKFDKW